MTGVSVLVIGICKISGTLAVSCNNVGFLWYCNTYSNFASSYATVGITFRK